MKNPMRRQAQGSACCVDQDALLAPSLAPVGGVASNGAPPKRALPMEQSADCHSQSTPPSSSQPSTRAAQMPPSTPHPTQRWKVRWMVLSSPNSLGKWFHWQQSQGHIEPRSCWRGRPGAGLGQNQALVQIRVIYPS